VMSTRRGAPCISDITLTPYIAGPTNGGIKLLLSDKLLQAMIRLHFTDIEIAL